MVFGIGGTGCLAGQWALQSVRERLGRRPDFMQFLVLDTTGEEAEAPVQLEVGDFINISGFNSNLYFQHADEFPYLAWLPAHEYLPGEINVGAHGKPHVGRLCYFMHREGLIKRAVDNKLAKLTHEHLAGSLPQPPSGDRIRLTSQASVKIHIVASLCGGAGAGCLLDAAYDLRRWCEDMTGHRPLIIGHLVLPEAFQLRCSESLHEQHRATAFALLAQINHFMGRNEAEVLYKHGPAELWSQTELPFDFCFLLDGASGVTTTSREKVCRNVGRMIALMATEYTGKRLWDRMINIYPGLQALGTDRSSLPVYSSYEVAVGSRPSHDLLALLVANVYGELGRLQTAPTESADHGSHFWSNTLNRVAADEVELRGELTKPFNQPLDGLEQNVNDGTLDIGDREAGQRLIRLVRDFLDKSPDAARKAIRSQVQQWLQRGLTAAAVQEQLHHWLQSEAKTADLPFFLRSLDAELDGHTTSQQSTDKPDKVAAELRSLADSDPDQLWQLPVNRERLRELVERYAMALLAQFWASEIRRVVDGLKHELGQLQMRLAQLSRQCRDYDAESSRIRNGRPTGIGAARLNLYSVPSDALDDPQLSGAFHSVLKHLVLELIGGEIPGDGYVRAIRRTLRESKKLRELMENALNGYFIESERKSLSDDKSKQAEEVKLGLQDLWSASAPRWLIQPDKTVEQVSCLVFPSTIRLHHTAHQLNEHDLESIEDNSYKEVLIVNTQHGAALTDLKNFALYEDSFDTTVERRKRLSVETEKPFRESDMWLDVTWNIRRPERKYKKKLPPDRAAISFGLLWQVGAIKTDGEGFVLVDQRGLVEQKLGDNFLEAFEAWRSPKNEPRMQVEYAKLCECGLKVLVETAHAALDELNELADGNMNSKTTALLRRIERALHQQLQAWTENLSLAKSLPEPEDGSPQTASQNPVPGRDGT